MVLKGSSLCVKSSSISKRIKPSPNFNRVILGVKTCEVFLCFQAIIFKGLFCIYCFLSLVSFTGFYTEYEPFKHPFSLVQITVKTPHQYIKRRMRTVDGGLLTGYKTLTWYKMRTRNYGLSIIHGLSRKRRRQTVYVKTALES